MGPSEKRIEPKIGSTSLRTSCCSTGGKLDRRRVINPVTFSLPLCQSSYFIQLGIFLFLPPLPVSSLDFWTCSWGHCNTQRPAYSPLATKGHTTLQLLFCKYLQSLFLLLDFDLILIWDWEDVPSKGSPCVISVFHFYIFYLGCFKLITVIKCARLIML